MKIGILGAGTVGVTLSSRFAELGHEVLLANSRGRESLGAKLAGLATPPLAATAGDALDADVVFLAVPWIRIRDVVTPDIDWSGRILVDTTNIFLSYAPDFRVDDLGGGSGSEIVARLAPTARVVKAFNTLPFARMFAATPVGMKRVLFVAGDDEAAVETVGDLISQIGLSPVAAGRLSVAGRQMELGGPFKPIIVNDELY